MTFEAPTEEVFKEMKEAATTIWNTYSNEFGYVDEKMETVNRMTNVQDNAMMFWRMFDPMNQIKMSRLLTEEAATYISDNN